MFNVLGMGAHEHAAGGAPFVPTDIAGCIMWLDASDPGSTTNQWDDKSGNANHATAANAIEMPDFFRNQALFDWSRATHLDLVSLAALTEGEVFCKLRRNADDSKTDGSTGLWNLGTYGSNDHYCYSNIYGSAFGTNLHHGSGDPTHDTSAYKTLRIHSAANDWGDYFDNVAFASTPYGTNTVSFPASPTLGKSVGSFYLDGAILAFVLFDNKLSSGDRALMDTYMDGLAIGAVPAAITDPTDITGCILWLDASDRGSTTDQWDDKSGEGNHFTSASGQFPTFSGGEAIFDGSTEFLTGPDFVSSLTEAETFWRVKQDSANPGLAVSALTEFGSNANSCHYTYLGRIFEGFGNTSRAMDVNPPLSIDSYRTINIWTAANDWVYKHDGNTLYSTATNTVGWITDPHIGKAKNFARYFDGNAKAFVIFDHKLNADERYQMEQYMASL